MELRQFLLVGLPGAGKGTQGAVLAEHFNIPLIGSGDMVRDHIARGTEFGLKVKAAAHAGDLVPDADIIYWMSRRLHEADTKSGFVLDGFPRNVDQAVHFDENFEDHRAALRVIELHVPESTVIARLMGREICPECGQVYNEKMRPPLVPERCDHDGAVLTRRADDAPDAIHRRIAVYEAETAPLVSYYCRTDRLITINADADEDTVFARILNAVKGEKHSAGPK